jgi:signal transduction histidine kinase
VAAFINTCLALIVATLVLVQPSALPLLGVVVVLLVLGYREYISLARGHAQTRLLYRFVDRTSSARTPEEVIETVLREAADLMHAEHAYLVEVTDDQNARYHTVRDGSMRAASLAPVGPQPWWWAALETGVVRYVRPRAGHGEAPGPAVEPTLMCTPRDGLAARLRGDGPARYVLVVCDRLFDKETFGAEDVQVFEALAAHAGIAVERARSVSALEALAAELEVARDAALAASEAKSLFLANMSHEIRTPLTAVLASTEILADTPLDHLQLELVEKMQRQGGTLKTLVESILDFSRIEAGQLSLASRPFDLHATVAEAGDTYESRAHGKGTCFEWNIDACVPRMVTGDPERLRQLLGKLLDNAVKFTHEGRVALVVRRATVAAEVVNGSGSVEFVVEDTGIGISREDQASIFEVFNQVDGSATRRYEGTGLGLAVCKRLAELMGGTITVDSELGAGSTFTVCLPLVGAQVTPADADEPCHGSGPARGLRSATGPAAG